MPADAGGADQIRAAVQLVRRLTGTARSAPLDGVLLPGASIGVCVLVTAAAGGDWVVKSVPGEPAALIAAEAEGLAALAATGTVAVPDVLHVADGSIVMSALRPGRADDPAFWDRLAVDISDLQAATTQQRHGWPADNWLGRGRQRNGWDTDGHRFYAECRLLHYLTEPLVRDALDAPDLAALQRLADRLPELLPAAPAVLQHGDLWSGNVLAAADGRPALIDPSVSYGWAEADVSWLRVAGPTAAVERFFDVWAERTRPEPGWRDRVPLFTVRNLLGVIAQHGDRGGLRRHVSAILAPFRPRAVGRLDAGS